MLWYPIRGNQRHWTDQLNGIGWVLIHTPGCCERARVCVLLLSKYVHTFRWLSTCLLCTYTVVSCGLVCVRVCLSPYHVSLFVYVWMHRQYKYIHWLNPPTSTEWSWAFIKAAADSQRCGWMDGWWVCKVDLYKKIHLWFRLQKLFAKVRERWWLNASRHVVCKAIGNDSELNQTILPQACKCIKMMSRWIWYCCR